MVHAVIKEKYHPALTLQPASMLVSQQQIQSSEFYVAVKVPPSILRFGYALDFCTAWRAGAVLWQMAHY